MICPQFVGRDEILSRLWDWLGDEFQYARVLAGDGGKGKTSIAYEFATQIVTTAPREIEQVIWLTAKQKQFKALDNDWVELPETHYSDLESLLKEIALRVALMDNEIEGLSVHALKGKLKEALERCPAFVIVDDVDSLTADDQKRVLETANVIGNPKSRFLLTTRANTSYSADLCITVPGLPKPEYEALLGALCERLKVDLPKNAADQLRVATEGSPLLTESILRLFLRGESLHRAIEEWKGQAGYDARAAALKKEIDRLSSESRRALLAAAYFGECSAAELRQALDYAPATAHKCIEELNSLFLLQAGRVTEDEPRFSISNTARIVVVERAKDLARDHAALASRIKALRTPSAEFSRRGNYQRIGAAIAQANAKLRDKDPQAAIAAVKAEMGRQGDHPDLLTMLGCCLAQLNPPQPEEARAAFRRAFERSAMPKEVLFEKWYEFEAQSEFGVGMYDVADLALSRRVGSAAKWQLRRSQGEVMQAALLLRAGDYISARSKLERVATGLVDLISTTTWVDRQNAIDLCRQVHDLLWSSLDRDLSVQDEERYRVALEILRHRDFRLINFQRLAAAAKGAALSRARRRDERSRSITLRILNESIETIREAIEATVESGRKSMLTAMRAELDAILRDIEHTPVKPKSK